MPWHMARYYDMSYDTSMTPLWHLYDTLWHLYDTSMTPLWHAMTPLWHLYDTLWHLYDTLWHAIVTCLMSYDTLLWHAICRVIMTRYDTLWHAMTCHMTRYDTPWHADTLLWHFLMTLYYDMSYVTLSMFRWPGLGFSRAISQDLLQLPKDLSRATQRQEDKRHRYYGRNVVVHRMLRRCGIDILPSNCHSSSSFSHSPFRSILKSCK